MKNLIEFCESIHDFWTSNNLPQIHNFQMTHLPEPYLIFGELGENPLVVINNNPGQGMWFQEKQNIQSHNTLKKLIPLPKTYLDIAKNLGDYYSSTQFKNDQTVDTKSAYRRVMKTIEIQKLGGFDSLVHVEIYPFHSPTLNKTIVANNDFFLNHNIISDYHTVLQETLSSYTTLYVGGARPASFEYFNNSIWYQYIANKLCGVSGEGQLFNILGDVVPSASIIGFPESRSFFSLMFGSNNLPANTELVAKIISK